MKLWKYIITVTAGIIMTASLVYGVDSNTENLFSEKSWKDSVESVDTSLFYAPHFRDGEYFNPWMEMDRKSFLSVLKWRFFSKKAEYTLDEEKFLPGVKALTAGYINSHDNFMSWIGHASVLVKSGGNVLITDPVLGEVPFVKKRRSPAALTKEEAASITGGLTVLITHNHYDHLDKESIMSFPQQTKFIVPAGLASEIKDMRGGEADVVELDWWDDISIGGVNITFLPSQHWSKRLFTEPDSSLWGSFIIDTGKKKIFICGDTGYSLLYREFSKKFKSIDYAFMSAGAYHPRWFMHYAHQDDSEAIQGFIDLKAKHLIPIHWGSFRLGDEPQGYPGIHIKNKFPDAIIMNHGDIIQLGK